ncbi:MAG: tetratricopeptide repeat protein [Bacteroidales bacterium]|nr:tetratricopeptide repeat protein [Bacteroidales bacterium]
MKRILLALTVLLSVQLADAQVKAPEAAKKAVDAAEAASKDAKKATKVATWLKLATAYMDAYNAPKGSAWLGASKQELQLVMGNDKPVSSENVVLAGDPVVKEVYAEKELYFNQNGQLVLIRVTKPVYADALDKAFDAYKKAYEVDVKKSKVKDITNGLNLLTQNYLDDGMNCYMFEDYAAASKLFGKAAEVSAAQPLNKVDTVALYNAGFTAWMVKDYPRAEEFFNKCLDINYYYEGGEVFAKLSDIYNNTDRKDKAREVLELGFTKFPQSQSILIGLINYYLESKQSPDRLFELIAEAKKNEPDNASLYYVEGNIYNELGQKDKAVEAYYKCAEINPEYEYGFIGAGILYYNQAIEIQDKAAAELDNAKYEALVEEFEKALLNALEPFEKAFAISKDDSIRVNIAEYLKNIYYRFSTKGADYEAGYNKYNEIVKTGVIK